MDKPGGTPAEVTVRQALIQALGEIVYEWRPREDRLDWGGAYERILGYARAELGADTASWTDRVHPDDLPGVLAEVERARAEHRPYDLEYRFRHRDGHYLWMHDRAVLFLDAAGEVERLIGVFRDVTPRRQAEEELRLTRRRIERLDRTRAVMGGINALIVRTRSRTELFQEACRIAVEQGGFGLAWIALAHEGTGLTPVAHFGDDGGELARRTVSLQEAVETASPAVLAVRQGRLQVCNDVARELPPGPARALLQRLGYASFVAQPLTVGEQVQGCLNLYAREPGTFDEDELRLLAELANDLGFALEFILRDEKLDFLSLYDPLTRLPNRALFVRRLADFVAAARDSGRRLAVLMMDVENFKAINDAIGQAGGDTLLKLVGERVKFHSGGPSYMARIAGDRFAAVLTDLDKSVDVEALVAAGGWDRLEPPFQHGDQEFAVTFRVGLAVYPQDGADADALLRNAELAVKRRDGRHRPVTRYTAAMSELAARKLNLDRQLRRALERDEFRLHYQPKIDLRTGAICGAEALLRWRNPAGADVPPDEIVPLMEETGLILDVGQWALGRALRDRAAWCAAGVSPPRVAVNVSTVQLRDDRFADTVARALAQCGAPGTALELEVTESVIMADRDAGVDRLRALREQGVEVAIDDFGTGYSSLAHLARLPINAVKIDRSFIAAMLDDPPSGALVPAIVALAHSIGVRTIAEGVETVAQAARLRALDCDELQGFLVSPAVASEEFAALLRSGWRLDARAG